MEPDEGSYIFASSLTSVVLPAPFSPTIATTAPAGSSRFTAATTHRSGPGQGNDTDPPRARHLEVHVVETHPTGARIAKRDMFEPDRLGQPFRGGQIGGCAERARV